MGSRREVGIIVNLRRCGVQYALPGEKECAVGCVKKPAPCRSSRRDEHGGCCGCNSDSPGTSPRYGIDKRILPGEAEQVGEQAERFSDCIRLLAAGLVLREAAEIGPPQSSPALLKFLD